LVESDDWEPRFGRSVGVFVITRLKKTVLLAALATLVGLPGLPVVAEEPALQHDTGDQAITIGVVIIDISKIEEREQQVAVDLGLRATWQVPELADESAPEIRTLPLEEARSPELLVFNARDLDEKLPQTVRVDRAGKVSYRQRLQGTLSTPMDLENFPFDTQEIIIQILCLGADGRSLIADIKASGIMEGTTVPGWIIEKPVIDTRLLDSLDGTRSYEIIETRYSMTRHQTFFLWKLFLPLTLIVFMAYAIFYLDPAILASQIAISTSSVFALIAYNFALSHMLPKTSYLTRADYFIIGCTILVFSAMYVTVVTGALARKEKWIRLAGRIDVWGRFIYPAAFLVVCWLCIGD
jgi:hypothetical protein